MTKLLAVSAYVAAMSFAIATEAGAGSSRADLLAKGDCERAVCAPAGDGRVAELVRTGAAETTAVRAAR